MVSSSLSVVLLGAAGWNQAVSLSLAPTTTAAPWQQGLRAPARTAEAVRSSTTTALCRRRHRHGVGFRMADDPMVNLGTLQHLTENAPPRASSSREGPVPPVAFGDKSNNDDDDSSSSSEVPLKASLSDASKKNEKNKIDTHATAGALSTVVVSKEDDNAPIDWILSRRLPINSRRFYRKALEAGDVKVDGRTVKRLVRVASGRKISVDAGPSSSTADTTPRKFLFSQRLPQLRVLFEDKHLVVVMKPAGMVCQPCEAAPSGTVLHGLLYHMLKRKQSEEGDLAAARTLSQGIVQRLDKHTSGVMVVAKTLDASSKLSKLFKNAKVRKEYLAICHGDPGFDSVIDVPLYRRSSGKVGAVTKEQAESFGAKDAKTRVRNVATAAGMSLCRAEIITGRMHQVRVHLKWKRCPIVGDNEYGDLEANDRVSRRNAYRVDARRPLLHSVSLEFTHPFTNKPMCFRAPMPHDMWEVAQNILRASGTPEQRQHFGELQELHQSYAEEERAPLGGRGAPREARRSKKRGGRGSAGAREAYDAAVAAGMIDRVS